MFAWRIPCVWSRGGAAQRPSTWCRRRGCCEKHTQCVARVQNHAGLPVNCPSCLMQTGSRPFVELTESWCLTPSTCVSSTACCGSPLVCYCPRHFTSALRNRVRSLLRGLRGTRRERNMRAAPGTVLLQTRPSPLIGQEVFSMCW